MQSTIQDILSGSQARPAAHLGLGEGCGVTIWDNARDRIRYPAPSQNTFSLYLRGGTGTRRVDRTGRRGYPGAVCVFPEGCQSEWDISAPFRFVHLYLSDARLRSGFAETHDCDARALSLPELTLADHPGLAAPLAQMASAAEAQDPLHAQGALADLIAALRPNRAALRGGLAPHVLRKLDAWIWAHLDQTISLHDLAALAGLSEYHFHRMFRLSRGMAPHGWVLRCRVTRARQMLRGDLPLAQIAAACGFSSQSHLTRAVQRHSGLTPAAYRRAARSR